MDRGTRTGVYFGATSGVITTIGLMVGLNAGTESVVAVVGGVVVIAIADSLSDALGIHLALESDSQSTTRQVWAATASAFLTKFLTALTFVTPILLLPLPRAVVASVLWGYLVIAVLSFLLARAQNTRFLPVVVEHLSIATFVVIAAHFAGVWVRAAFT